jgi:GNAT superfamily N-acetyltransferase
MNMSGWSHENMLRALFEAPRRGFEPMPDSTVVERPGWWRLTTPSFRNGGFNEVALSALPEDEADDVIDATLADYARLGVSFRWTVGPESAPSDLGGRLALRGLVAEPVWGMAAELARTTFETAPESIVRSGTRGRASIAAERVTLDSGPTFTAVMAEGWSTAPATLEAYHLRVLHSAQSQTRLFLATVAGEPAGTASYVVVDDVAFLMGAVVLPRFRGRGAYRELVRARLRDAAIAGCTLAATHAGALSAPILSRVGFVSVCEFAMFTPP